MKKFNYIYIYIPLIRPGRVGGPLIRPGRVGGASLPDQVYNIVGSCLYFA